MATAGSIVIDLLMRTGSFETDSKRAEKRLKQFKKKAEEAGKAIGVAVVAAGTAITALVKTSIDTMDELSKAAQRSNTTTEQFSKLAYGAGLADVSIQDLQGSLGKLAKAQGDALDAGSEQAKVFRALGIEVKNADGSLRDTTAVLEDFADRFQALKGSPEAVAAGMAIFGRSFQNLIPLIKDGSQGLRDAGVEAAKYGQVISTEAGQQAEQFNDNLTRMALYVRGVGNAVAEDLLPDLIELSDRFLDASTEGEKMAETAKGLADFIRVIGGAIEFAVPYFKAIDDVIQGATISMVGLAEAARGVINLDWDQIKRGIDVLQQGSAQAVLGEEKAIAGGYIDAPTSASRRTRAGSGRRGGAAMGGSGVGGATQEEIDAYTRKLREALAGEDKGGKGGGGGGKSSRTPYSLADSLIADREALAKLLEEEERARTQFEAWAAQLSGPVADANYRYARDLEELNELAAKGAIGSDELTRAQENLRKEHERNVEAIQERLEPGKQLLKDLQFELDLMKLTNAERATAIQLRGLDTEQIQKYGDAIAETNRKIMENAEQADFMDGWRGEFQDFFSDVLTGTKSIGDAFEDMLSNISAMIAERIAQNWVDQLFGQMGTTNGGAAGGGEGGWLSGLASIFSSFGGSRAGGGDVLANRGYWVGEQGPEWFQPRTAGTVLPHEESMQRARGAERRSAPTVINVAVEGRVERQTRVQIGTEVDRSLQRSRRIS